MPKTIRINPPPTDKCCERCNKHATKVVPFRDGSLLEGQNLLRKLFNRRV